jgi:5-methylcytosine-specific restriction endonuclease McrA
MRSPLWAKAGKRGAAVQILSSVFLQDTWADIVRRDPCPYCCVTPRADFGRHRMTLEHVQPRGQGGSSGWANLVGAHQGCNYQRSDRGLLQFLLFRQRSAGANKATRKRLRREFFGASVP